MNRAYWLSILLLLQLAHPVLPKRGGGGFGSIGRSGGRGSSSARSGILGGGSRGSSSGGFGGGHHSGGGYKPSGGHIGSHGNMGRTGGGGWNSGHGTSGGWGHSSSNTGWNPKHSSSSGSWSRPHTSTYSKGSGIGSMVRSNTFKNAIVGAAAGYLTYQAGKAIIRSMAGPMHWGGRNYYWGQNYYQPRHGQNQMCRMPIDPNDNQFGNVYFQDNTRPREIVWGCGWGEYCCGYECCRGGGASTYGYGLPAGYAFALVFLARHYLF